MGNTNKRLTALNADSIRSLIKSINERQILKEDVLDIICKEDYYFLLYYEDCD